MPDFLTCEANLREAMRFFGDATGLGGISQLDGATAIYSGLDYGVFNIALLQATPPLSLAGLEKSLAACARHYMPRTLRWSFWLCEDLLDPAALKRVRPMLHERGLNQISSAPGMIAPALRAPTRILPAIECRPVTDRATRDVFGSITSISFDIPRTIARAVYSPERAWNGSYRGFVGMVRGEAVAIVAIVATADCLGIYSLATLPQHRHRGYGEALLRAAVAAEQERTGITRLTLQSTDAGYTLYRFLGFSDVARFAVFLTK